MLLSLALPHAAAAALPSTSSLQQLLLSFKTSTPKYIRVTQQPKPHGSSIKGMKVSRFFNPLLKVLADLEFGWTWSCQIEIDELFVDLIYPDRCNPLEFGFQTWKADWKLFIWKDLKHSTSGMSTFSFLLLCILNNYLFNQLMSWTHLILFGMILREKNPERKDSV